MRNKLPLCLYRTMSGLSPKRTWRFDTSGGKPTFAALPIYVLFAGQIGISLRLLKCLLSVAYQKKCSFLTSKEA